MILLIWSGVLFLTLVVYLQMIYSRFSRCGVKNMMPVPFLGNVGSIMLRKKHVGENAQELYNAFPNERFMGRFELIKPVIVLRDLDLIKQVTIKDFENFINHRNFMDETIDSWFERSVFSLKDQEWKDMRSTLSPLFTSSKIRAMVPFMVDVNKQMVRMLKKKIEESESGYIDIDCKALTTRYTNDVIASCAFGVKLDSHTDTSNEFYLHGKSLAHFNFKRMLFFFGYCTFPRLMKKLNLALFGGKANDFFVNLFLNTMTERKTKNIFRPDMIHLLLEAKKGNLKHDDNVQIQDMGFATVEESEVGKSSVNRSWSDIDLISQAIFFFAASFETISTAMCFLLHELALNPDIQERLVQEIRENEANNGTFNYESIQNLKYLDKVISELLRLWPPGVGTDRICTKDYNLGKPNDKAKKDFILRKGEPILIPVWAIHHDPDYFPDPEKFDPERFSDENKANIKPFSYIPFGAGPRNCIGSRFALCELKVMAYLTLLELEVSPCAKTQIPAKLDPNTFLLSIKGGHWARFKLRS